jgi:hypothetical protein
VKIIQQQVNLQRQGALILNSKADPPGDPPLPSAERILFWDCVRRKHQHGDFGGTNAIQDVFGVKAYTSIFRTKSQDVTENNDDSYVAPVPLDIIQRAGENEPLTLGHAWASANVLVYLYYSPTAKSRLVPPNEYKSLANILLDVEALSPSPSEEIIPIQIIVGGKLEPSDEVISSLCKAVRKALRKENVSVNIQIRSADESEVSTQIILELTRSQLADLMAAYTAGDFKKSGVLAIEEIDARTTLIDVNVTLDLSEMDAERKFAVALRSAIMKAMWLRPWRRLGTLFSWRIERMPLARVIYRSNERFFTATLSNSNREKLKTDLVSAFIYWPALSAVLMTIGLWGMHLLGFQVAWLEALATGIVLSVAGAAVCSCVLSPLSCGAGIIGFAFFGIFQGIIIAQYGTTAALDQQTILEKPFYAIAGGLIGLAAPNLHHDFPKLFVFEILCIASSIATSGWLMAQPERAAGKAVSNTQILKGTLYGATAGLGLGIIYGLTEAFRVLGIRPHIAFTLSFVMIGTAAFLRTLHFVKIQNTNRCVFCGLYICLALATLTMAFTQNAPANWIFISMGCGIMQSTFFTLAYMQGHSLGGYRAGIGSTFLEGAFGFTVFILIRALTG